MEDSIILSPSAANHKPKEQWKTPIRSTVRLLRRQGKSYGEIKKLTGLERSTIQGIVKGVSSRLPGKERLLSQKPLSKLILNASSALSLNHGLIALSPWPV